MGRVTLPPQNLVVAYIATPYSYCHGDVDSDVDPCSFLAMSKAISEASKSVREDTEVRRTAYRKDRLLRWGDSDSTGRSHLMVEMVELIVLLPLLATLVLIHMQFPICSTPVALLTT